MRFCAHRLTKSANTSWGNRESPLAFLHQVGYTVFITSEVEMMKQALNATDIKRQNQRLIMDAVFRSGSTSRSRLSKELSLSKPAISDNLTELLEAGIVRESGFSPPVFAIFVSRCAQKHWNILYKYDS